MDEQAMAACGITTGVCVYLSKYMCRSGPLLLVQAVVFIRTHTDDSLSHTQVSRRSCRPSESSSRSRRRRRQRPLLAARRGARRRQAVAAARGGSVRGPKRRQGGRSDGNALIYIHVYCSLSLMDCYRRDLGCTISHWKVKTTGSAAAAAAVVMGQ